MNGYVLAGGLSSRMGADKGRLPHDGTSAAAHLAGLLTSLGLAASIVRRHDDGLPWIDASGRPVRAIHEPDDGPRHPLRGVLAALDDAEGPALILPCDLPEMTADALGLLCHAPCVADGHPLVAHLPAALRDRAARIVAAQGPARALTEGLPRVVLPEATLRDRNTGGGPWPGDRLRARLQGLPPTALSRVLAGERARQRARGVVDPSLEPDR